MSNTGTHDLYKNSAVKVGTLQQTGSPVMVGNANYTFRVEDSGKPHIIANVSADRTFALPAVAVGLHYPIIAEVGAADGHDWIIVAAATANLFKGGVWFLDTDAGPPTTVANVVADQSDDDQLQVNLPQGGTRIDLYCDGTYWIASGMVASTAAPAFS